MQKYILTEQNLYGDIYMKYDFSNLCLYCLLLSNKLLDEGIVQRLQ